MRAPCVPHLSAIIGVSEPATKTIPLSTPHTRFQDSRSRARPLAANSLQSQNVTLFDFEAKKWTALDSGGGVMQWSRDGKFLYHLQYGKDPAIMRVRMSDRKVERLASLSGVRLAGFLAGVAFGMTPDGSPIILRDTGTEEIYSLDWHAD
jgi:hypothetical protein